MRDIAVWHDNSCWVAEIIAPDCEDDGIRVEGETEEDTLGAARALAKGPFQILRCGAPS